MEQKYNVMLRLKVGLKAINIYNYKFNKKIEIQNIFESDHLSDFEIIKFFQNLTFKCQCHQSHVRNYCNRNFTISCVECSKQILKLNYLTNDNIGILYVCYICDHLKEMIYEIQTPYCRVLQFRLDIDEQQAIYFKKTYSSEHPIRVVGKIIYNSSNNSYFKLFLKNIIYSNTWEYKINLKSSNCSNLEEIIQTRNGYYFIYLYQNNNNNQLLRYNNQSVQCLCWINPNIVNYIKIGSYIQLDASFYALHPYTYSIPLLIYKNTSIPLGLVMGPSESEQLYETIYECMEKIIGSKMINDIPILSDEGKGILAFVKNRNIEQFFCYRHLIEKIGANTYIGQIVKRLLYIPSIDFYEIAIIQAISEVNMLIKSNNISIKAVKQFAKIFGLYINNENMLQLKSSNHRNGLWNRQILGISTCSNHIESLHKQLNSEVLNYKNIYIRTSIVLTHIMNFTINYSKNSRRQVNKLLKKLMDNAKKLEIKQVIKCEKCGWGEVYTNRFGIENFPCIHTILNCKIQFDDLNLPISNIRVNNIKTINAFENWIFPINENIKFNFTVQSKELEFVNFNDRSVNYFLLQTSKEICATKGCILNSEDALIEISKLWGSECKNDNQINDIDFRTKFRMEVYKKYIKNQ